jgi:predicted kinase
MTQHARPRAVRRSDAGTRAQTRELGAHRHELAGQLRSELGIPSAPAGRAALVLLMGLPGVGKTHCARLLAAELGAAHVATDHLRSRLFIAPSYADAENAAVFGIAEALVDELLAEGHTVVLDATNLVARNRAPAERIARDRGAALFHVLITSDDAETRARLLARARDRAAGDHSDADVRIFERMREHDLEPPAGGHLEIHNGPNVTGEVARVASAVRAAE